MTLKEAILYTLIERWDDDADHNMLKTFKNELGNKITISLAKAPDVRGAKQITIKMVGPKSTAENTITEQEAKVLWQMLSDVFRRNLIWSN